MADYNGLLDGHYYMYDLTWLVRQIKEQGAQIASLPDQIKVWIAEGLSDLEINKLILDALTQYGMAINVLAPPAGLTPATADGTTDSTDAIQGCLDYAARAGGKVVFFPYGKYLTRPLTVSGSCALVGFDARNTTLFLAQGAQAPLLTVNGWEGEISGLTLDANAANQVDAQTCIRGAIIDGVMRDVTLSNGTMGVDVTGGKLYTSGLTVSGFTDRAIVTNLTGADITARLERYKAANVTALLDIAGSGGVYNIVATLAADVLAEVTGSNNNILAKLPATMVVNDSGTGNYFRIDIPETRKDVVKNWIQTVAGDLTVTAGDHTLAATTATTTVTGKMTEHTGSRESTVDVDSWPVHFPSKDIDLYKIGGVFMTVLDFGAKGDGVTDDTTAINAAITAANAQGGGTVFFPAGHTFVFTQIDLKSNVRLYSDGGVLKYKDNTAVSADGKYYLLVAWGGDNIVLDSLIIDGNASHNTKFLVCDGITVAGCENVVIKDCLLHDIPDSGIMFSNCANSACINNRIDKCSDCGIYYNTGDGNTGYQNILAFNRISNIREGSGIALKRVSQRISVVCNTIRDSANGITLENASTASDYSTDIMICNNRLYYISGAGINLRSSAFCNVSGNRIQIYGQYGILIEGLSYANSIQGNVLSTDNLFEGTQFTGGLVLLNRDKSVPSSNTFCGNVIIGGTHGTTDVPALRLASNETPNAQGARNIFTGNVFQADQVAVTVGLYYNDGILMGNALYSSSASIVQSGDWVITGNQATPGITTEGRVFTSTSPRQSTWVSDTQPDAALGNVNDIAYAANPNIAIGWVKTSTGWRAFGTLT